MKFVSPTTLAHRARMAAKPRRATPMCALLADAPRSLTRVRYHDIRRQCARFARPVLSVVVYPKAGFSLSMVRA